MSTHAPEQQRSAAATPQLVPSVASENAQAPAMHAPTWHGSSDSQIAPGMHSPVTLQLSASVHASPSSQSLPAGNTS